MSAKARGLGGITQSKKIDYNGVKLGSSYEVKLAISLDAANIKWTQPGKFKYKDLEGKQRTYTPDFYLPDFKIYLDPKNDFLINNVNSALGFKDSDKILWAGEQNSIRIFILSKHQLTWDAIKEILDMPV